MAENSKIEWTHHTFNPWIGCTEVSPACDHCYARVLMQDRFKKAEWGKGKERVLASDAMWEKPFVWNRRAEKNGVRERVFCASLADVFDTEVPDEWRHRLFNLIRVTPHLDWLLLTKRAAKAASYYQSSGMPWPVNAWIGVTVESPKYLNRLKAIEAIPAPVRFASVEPLLEPFSEKEAVELCRLADWVIVGGESGKDYREMPLSWARMIGYACEEVTLCDGKGAAFFFKQTAGKGEIPEDLQIRQFPTPHMDRVSR